MYYLVLNTYTTEINRRVNIMDASLYTYVRVPYKRVFSYILFLANLLVNVRLLVRIRMILNKNN